MSLSSQVLDKDLTGLTPPQCLASAEPLAVRNAELAEDPLRHGLATGARRPRLVDHWNKVPRRCQR